MKKDLLHSILIYTDGACSGNPGPGGWACVVATPEGKIKELGGFKEATTNNEMELIATIRALLHVKETKLAVHLYTDSTYVIRGITKWVWGWKRRGWKTAEGNEVANRELWENLSALVLARGKKEAAIEWKYSRGHVGTPGNERCDEIAVAFSKRQWIDLYEGPLLQYSVAIYDVPADCELPEMRPKEVKVPAFSYLSYLGGEVCRHRDWADCERRVKGKSGAKFKKAMSEKDESEIIKTWGLSPGTTIKG